MSEDHTASRRAAIGIVLIFLVSSTVGCLSDSQDHKGIELIVHYENTNGTIVDSYIDGDHVSTTNVFLDFDFSNTISENNLVEYGIQIDNDSEIFSVDPNIQSTISVEFSHHGIYEIIAYAMDDNNNLENKSITIRIEQQINWLESNTYEPTPLPIIPFPNNEGVLPSAIIINSTVENPVLIENIGGGREVEITWRLLDEQEDACQSKNEIVYEGEQATWKTIHFNTVETHELSISYDDGQDYIDVNHSVLIQYPSLESSSN
tara:strand:+ start:8970 stop:9755 length:786 start_codon:yes stop_codon:yes gene_type:complete